MSGKVTSSSSSVEDGFATPSGGPVDVSSEGSADMDVGEAAEVESLSPVQDLLE